MQKRPAEDELNQRSTKKQKIESSSNFLSLPKDILVEICHYITRVEDAMRFEITCKSIRSLMAKEFTELHIIKNDQFEQIERMLSRDLHYLNSLSLELRRLKWEQTNWLVNKLSTVLPDLRNLTNLKLNFEFSAESQQLWMMTYGKVCDAIKKMTWLEALDYQYPSLSDLTEAFANHHKLTELIISGETTNFIEAPHVVKGFDKLTQVKALTLHSQTTDDIFNEVLQLTNLTALDMDWVTLSYDNAKNISQLTNLERLVCPVMVFRGPWKSLLSLTKLTNLEGDIATMKHEDSMEDLNQMTQLTSLNLSDHSNSRNLMPERLSNLTNLQNFSVDNAIGSANFGVLSSLTQLSIGSWNILEVGDFTLPQRLKHLEFSLDISAAIFKPVVQLTSLETLSIFLDKTWCKPSVVKAISNLTNLRELQLVYDDSFPSGIGKSLEKLPLLQSLFLNEVCNEDIAQLKHLTQLNQLEVSNINDDTDLETLREQLPFIVYKGEVDNDEEDEEDDDEDSEEDVTVRIVPGAFQII